MSDPLAELLALERSYDDLPEGADARILARVESVVAGGPGDGGDGGEGPSGGGHAGSGAPSTLTVATKGVSLLARAAYVAVGVVAGAAGHAVLATGASPSGPGVVIAAAPSSRATVALGAESAAPPGVRVEDLPPSPPVAAASSVTRTTRRDDGRIREERADLDVARTALSLGRIDACLEGIERHQRTYGEGHFAEEREVLAVQALAAAGRRTEAAARAQRFRQKYPTSLFGPAIAESLASP